MGLRDWLMSLFRPRSLPRRAIEPADPSAIVTLHLARLPPDLRTVADALRREAIADFGSEQTADAWFCSDVPFIGGRPVDALHTLEGQAQITLTLHNLRYGIYS